jgi:SAM-dependent methyltransferase
VTGDSSGVHAVAAAGFDAQAEVYERARPGYPDEALTWLMTHVGAGPESIVLDLAAGTGKFTGPLAARTGRLVAAEPLPGMYAQLHRRLPHVPLVAAVAEALPFAGASVDLVTVAQAFHWFDARATMAELARVIRPGGHLALIWNAADRSHGWVDQVWTVMDRVEHTAPWRDHGDGTAGRRDGANRWREDSLVAEGPWSPFSRAAFTHRQQLSPDGVVERLRSVSHVAVLPPAERKAVLDEVRTIVQSHPDTSGRATLHLPYRTDVVITRRL